MHAHGVLYFCFLTPHTTQVRLFSWQCGDASSHDAATPPGSTDPQLHASDTGKGEKPEGETFWGHESQWVTFGLGKLQDFVDGL